ncbi:hypothetical protein ONZ45_g6443 [Pleurotus djamor]|nr:hypothetical protein ONZ45_g6443 [Pleurotus djamor]
MKIAPAPKRTVEQHRWLKQLTEWSRIEPQDFMDSLLRLSFMPPTGQPTEWTSAVWLRPILTEPTFPSDLSYILLNECELRPGKELLQLWFNRDSPADFIVRAYRRKNFQTLLNKESVLLALSQAFNEPPIGNLCERFLQDVKAVSSKTCAPVDPFGRAIYLTNSSGSGKSYLVKSLANECISIDVSFGPMVEPLLSDPPKVDWPPPDEPGEELAGVFLGALFATMADILQQTENLEMFNKYWEHVYRPEHVVVCEPEEALSMPLRDQSFQEVVRKASQMLEATSWSDLRARLDTSESSIYCWCDCIFEAVMKPHLDRLCRLARSLYDGRIFIAFEGLSELDAWGVATGWSPYEPRNHITMFAFKQMIRSCQAYSSCWFLILGRHVDQSTLLPVRNHHPPSTESSLPPWPYLDYDLMVREAFRTAVSPREALSLGHLKYYGRPLWSGLHGRLDLIKFGISKLTLRAYWLQPDTSTFAILSARVLPRLMHGSLAASRLASVSVRDHMRILCWDDQTSIFSTFAPSEPILSLAAAVYMLDEQAANQYARYQDTVLFQSIRHPVVTVTT